MWRFCEGHDIPYEITGKVVVATDEDDRARIVTLLARGRENGVRVEVMDGERLRCLEPHARGLAALHVLDAGVVDFRRVCEVLAQQLRRLGAEMHLSRGIDGSVRACPNAVLVLAREGYSWSSIDRSEFDEMLRFPDLRKFARREWRTGLTETVRSLSRHSLTRALRKLVPEIDVGALRRPPSGVRAQAVSVDGELLDDLVLRETPTSVHVVNAPSPGTMSLARDRTAPGRIGDDLAGLMPALRYLSISEGSAR